MSLPFKNASFTILEKLSSAKIIKQYQSYYNIDVSSYFRGLDAIEIRECSLTKLRYYYPPSTIGDTAFYMNLLHEGDYTRQWEFDHQFAFTQIQAGTSLLEIGCGSGAFLERLKSKGVEARGIELSDGMVEICRAKNLDVIKMDIKEFANLNAEKFDVICFFQVLEHIYEVENFLISALKCLKKGGKLFISTPNNEPYYANDGKYETLNLPPHHMTLWSIESYRSVGLNLGLKVNAHSYGDAPSLKGKIYYKLQRLLSYSDEGFSMKYLLNVGLAMVFTFLDILRGKYKGNFIVVELLKP